MTKDLSLKYAAAAELYKLGLQKATAARLLGLSVSPGLTKAWSTASQDVHAHPPRDIHAYSVQLRAFIHLHLKLKDRSDAEELVWSALLNHLKMPEHFAYLKGVEALAERLVNVQRKTEQIEPYRTLIRATFGFPEHQLHVGPLGYWRDVQDRIPDTDFDLKADMVQMFDTLCRYRILPPWPDNGVAVIDAALDSLENVGRVTRRDVLRARFGLGEVKLSLEAAGRRFNVTKERVRQIEAAGLRALKRQASENDLLATFKWWPQAASFY